MADLNYVYGKWEAMNIDRPMALIERRRLVGVQVMVSHVTLRKGCFVPSHAHLNEQIACVLSGALRFGLGPQGLEKELVVSAGESILLPANLAHSAYAMEDTVVLDVFSPPSEKTGIDASRP